MLPTTPQNPAPRKRRTVKSVRILYARLLKLVWDNTRKVHVTTTDGARDVRNGAPLPEIVRLGEVLFKVSGRTVRRAITDMMSDNLIVAESIRDGRSVPPTMLLRVSGDSHGRRC